MDGPTSGLYDPGIQQLTNNVQNLSLSDKGTTPSQNITLFNYLKRNNHCLKRQGGCGPLFFSVLDEKVFGVWYSHIQEKDILNIQRRENFLGKYSPEDSTEEKKEPNTLQKLGMEIDKKGNIVSLFSDGQSVSSVPKERTEWLFLAHKTIIKEKTDKFGREIVRAVCICQIGKEEKQIDQVKTYFTQDKVEILFRENCTELKDLFFNATWHLDYVKTDKDDTGKKDYCGVSTISLDHIIVLCQENASTKKIVPLGEVVKKLTESFVGNEATWEKISKGVQSTKQSNKQLEIICDNKPTWNLLSDEDVSKKRISKETAVLAFVKAVQTLAYHSAPVTTSDIQAFEEPKNAPLLRFVGCQDRLQLEIFFYRGTWKMKDVIAKFMHSQYGDSVLIQKDHAEWIGNSHYVGKIVITELSVIKYVIKWIFDNLSNKNKKDLLSCLVGGSGFNPGEIVEKIIDSKDTPCVIS